MGLLLEKPSESEYVSGNLKIGILKGDKSSHAWTEFIDREKNEYIIDRINRFCGKREQYEKEVLEDLIGGMFY